MKSVEEKKKERKLNKGQLAVLTLLYRYRFTTSELLAKFENQKHLQVTRSRLANLEKQGYIGKRYDGSYKLAGKFASYYLLPKGLRYLKSLDVADSQVIKMIYNDSKASDKFIDFYSRHGQSRPANLFRMGLQRFRRLPGPNADHIR